MPVSSELSPGITKILSLIELLIVSKRIPIREFERRLRMSNGTLARLFSGKITLKLQTLLDMLTVLEVDPQAFFAAAFSVSRSPSAETEDLLRRVQSLSFPEPPPLLIFSKADIKRLIEEVLDERLVRSEVPAESPPVPEKESPAKPKRRTTQRHRPNSEKPT
jgi:transcriptional regulator with XRE-family HTH domain